jgi:PAS domain S-box-containing protein
MPVNLKIFPDKTFSDEMLTEFIKSHFDFSPDCILIFSIRNSEISLIYIDEGFEFLTGYSEDDLKKGIEINKFVLEDSRETLKEMSKNILNSNRYKNIFKIKSKDGKVLNIENHLLPLKKYKGYEDFVILISRNITPDNYYINFINESDLKFKNIFNNVPVAIALIDSTGNIIEANYNLSKYTGYSIEELKNIKLSQITHPEEIYKSSALFHELKEGKRSSYNFEKRYIKKDGELIWVKMAVSKLMKKSKSNSNFIVILENITEKKVKEKQLNQFKLSVTQSADTVFITDTEGYFQYINPAFEKLSGYTMIDCAGKTPRILKSEHQDINYYEKLWRTIKNGDIFRSTVTNKKKSGELFYGEQIITPIKNSKGEIVNFLSNMRDATIRITYEKKLEERYERLSVLHSIEMITKSSTHDITLDSVLNVITGKFGIENTSIYLFDKSKKLKHAYGSVIDNCFRDRYNLYENFIENALLSKKVKIFEISEKNFEFFHTSGYECMYIIPLISENFIKGALILMSKNYVDRSSEWSSFLEIFGTEITLSLENFELLKNLRKKNEELIEAYDETIEGWARALDLRDKETEGHTRRVTELTLKLAKRMGFSEKELINIKRGAMLHDIGKLGVPDNILLKPGKLNDEEWKIMKKHTIYAREMLYPIEYLRPAINIPYYHHERWDGKGYPEGLKEKKIPLEARIFAIIDVWDALTSDRPYRKALSKDEVREYIKGNSGSHFDPEVVKTFLKLNL